MQDATPWDMFLTGQDRVMMEAVGAVARPANPRRPAVVLLGVTQDYFGPKGATAVEAVQSTPAACGPRAWKAVPVIQQLLAAARSCGAPVIAVQSPLCADVAGTWSAPEAEVLPELGLRPDDPVLRTDTQGGFWPDLLHHLAAAEVDGILLAGGRMSGAVRSALRDGLCHDMPAFVVPDAVFDRYEAAQAMALFECHMQLGTVIGLPDALGFFAEGEKPGAG